MKLCEEIVDFIASLRPRELVEFKPSEQVRQRFRDLLEHPKAARLPAEDGAELDYY